MKIYTKIKFFFKVLGDVFWNIVSLKSLYYIVENANWSIKHDGINITANLKAYPSRLAITHYGIRNAIIHFGSIHTFWSNSGPCAPHKSNKIVVSWFHVVPGDRRLHFLSDMKDKVDMWHTSSSITQKKLIAEGIPRDKIKIIPLGVDLKVFRNAGRAERKDILRIIGIPEDVIVIGSFQKDGIGWKRGLLPKMIKGPDIFCDSVEKIAKKKRIVVLLTGPAREYVKMRLEQAGILYKHFFLTTHDEIAHYYRALDLYIVASREEGGPKAVLESLASGVPVVSTRVGMVPDIVQDGFNGLIANKEDSEQIANLSLRILDDIKLRDRLICNGLETVRSFAWNLIADEYCRRIYEKV